MCIIGAWGELASQKIFFNPPTTQFSMLGICCPTFYLNACLLMFVYLGG